MSETRRIVPMLVALCALACSSQDSRSERSASENVEADRAAIGTDFQRRQEELRRAWELKDARLVFRDSTDQPALRTPDGQLMSRKELIADLQRRMNMVKSIDYMIEEIDSIDVRGDEAVVMSRQRFSRVIVLPDGNERRRISSVTHRRRYGKTAEGWRPVGPLEESNPTGKWEDEP